MTINELISKIESLEKENELLRTMLIDQELQLELLNESLKCVDEYVLKIKKILDMSHFHERTGCL